MAIFENNETQPSHPFLFEKDSLEQALEAIFGNEGITASLIRGD